MGTCRECNGNKVMPSFTDKGGLTVPCRTCDGAGYVGPAPAAVQEFMSRRPEPAAPKPISLKPATSFGPIRVEDLEEVELILELALNNLDRLTEEQQAFVLQTSGQIDPDCIDYELTAEETVLLSEVAIRLKVNAEGTKPGHWAWLAGH